MNPASGLKEYVLVVDDEEGIRDCIAELVVREGVPCLVAGSGVEALALFRKNPVFLVLTDYGMPGGDGLTLARACRSENSRVTVALFTGFADKQLAVEGVRAGLDDLFDKPADLGKLRDYLRLRIAGRQAEISAEEAEMSTLRGIFCEEATELFRDIDQVIFRLEENPGDAAVVDLLFRKAHTLKGSAGAFKGTELITRVTHSYEQLLVALKDGRLEVTGELTDVLLGGADVIRTLVGAYCDGKETDIDVEPLVASLQAVAAEGTRSKAKDATGGERETSSAPASQGNTAQGNTAQGNTGHARGGEGMRSAAALARGREAGGPPQQEEDDGILVSNEKLASFMELSGELVVFKNSYNVIMRQVMALDTAGAFRQQVDDLSHALGKISDQIQSQIMDVRKVALKVAFGKFNRVVRQVAQDLRKQIRFEMVGADLGVDKTIAKALAACLVHILRNGADHGIEMPDERVRRGKPEAGLLRIECAQQGEQIVVHVRDDGQGVRTDKVVAKALERGLIDEARAAQLKPRDIVELLFLPGFSTAEKVTNVSGRGVGMDVVRSEISKLGGSVELTSEEGRGTAYEIRVPVPRTVLVENAILAESDAQLLAIPLTSIAKIASCSDLVLARVSGRLTCQHEGNTVPVARLGHYLGQGDDEGLSAEGGIVVLVAHKGRTMGLLVDRVVDQLEAVVRPFDAVVEGVPGFKGTSLLDDEKVAYVLSAEDIVRIALAKENAA